jgi:hypothetical protein
MLHDTRHPGAMDRRPRSVNTAAFRTRFTGPKRRLMPELVVGMTIFREMVLSVLIALCAVTIAEFFVQIFKSLRIAG